MFQQKRNATHCVFFLVSEVAGACFSHLIEMLPTQKRYNQLVRFPENSYSLIGLECNHLSASCDTKGKCGIIQSSCKKCDIIFEFIRWLGLWR